MDGTIDFIILEHDDVAGCALIAGAVDGVVPAIDGYNTPYVVAKGYDHATRNWEDCTLFDDIVKAKLACAKPRSAASASRTRSTRPRRPRPRHVRRRGGVAGISRA